MMGPAHALDSCRILIATMTSWGEAGNWLSAKSLEATIARAAPGASVTVQAADELVPAFRQTGRAIKAATLNSGGPEERKDRYAAVLRALGERFPPGFEERSDGAPTGELNRLADWIAGTKPDLLIATKGVLCRALLAASRLAGIEVPVVDYVTNHGHFAFEVHRCQGARMHLVRIPDAKRFLEVECGFNPATVRVVGYLVAAQPLLPAAPTPPPGTRASLIVVSNRGGEEYVHMLRRLAPYAGELNLTFIALHDERLQRSASAVAASAGAQSWQVVTNLDQAKLFELMHQARGSPVCALVCKASPNSIFEAAYFRLPMFLLRTGLPMEEWGADLVVRERLGIVAKDMDVLTSELIAHLLDPRAMANVRARLDAFADRQLDQERTIRLLMQALSDALTAAATP
ncbi:MAG: hypothetical protein ACRDRO_22310 [Pseudonocardiaceae bacterium]